MRTPYYYQHVVPNNEWFENEDEEAAKANLNSQRDYERKCEEAVIDSRRKGKAGEQELANLLTDLFGNKCRRGQQYSGLGAQDVVGLPGVHIECKRVERLNLQQAVSQAIIDALPTGDVPTVWHRKNGGPWLVTVPAKLLPRLVAAINALKEGEPDGTND